MPQPFDDGVEVVKGWCQARIPERLRDEIRIEYATRGSSITVFESRPPSELSAAPDEWFRLEVAQLRRDPGEGRWALYCRRASGRWQRFDPEPEAEHVQALLAAVDEDPTGIFWG